MDTTKTFLKLI